MVLVMIRPKLQSQARSCSLSHSLIDIQRYVSRYRCNVSANRSEEACSCKLFEIELRDGQIVFRASCPLGNHSPQFWLPRSDTWWYS